VERERETERLFIMNNKHVIKRVMYKFINKLD